MRPAAARAGGPAGPGACDGRARSRSPSCQWPRPIRAGHERRRRPPLELPLSAVRARELTIDGVRIADDTDCWVIAEIGHNHQGSLEQAEAALRRGGALRSECGQAPEARQRGALHARVLQQAVREREQLRPDLRPPPRGARVRPRRIPGAEGVRGRARGHVLRHRLRLRERRAARRSRPARLQDRLGRPDEHTAAPRRGRDRQADDPLHRRRHARRRAARLRDRRRDQPADRHPPVHRRVSGGVAGARPARDRHLPAAVPRRRRRLLGARQRNRHAGRGVRARGPHRREALHAQPGDEGHRPPLLARAGRAAQAGARPAAHARSRSATGRRPPTRARATRSRR